MATEILINIARALFGMIVLIGLAYLLSNNRAKIDWSLVWKGLMIQLAIGLAILIGGPGKQVMEGINAGITSLVNMSSVGSEFMFGTFKIVPVALSVSATIIFFSSFMAMLFYFGVIQFVVKWMSKGIIKVLSVSGAEALAACANVFIGQTEAPLVVKPYLPKMTKSELMAMMVGGMATISGGMLAIYVSIGADAGHLVAASIMAAPASLVVAKILFPETEEPETKGLVSSSIKFEDVNVFQAMSRGAVEGLQLSLNVVAVIVAFVSIAALFNLFLGYLPEVAGAPLSFERILGWVFAPLAYVIGVDFADASIVGGMLGKKMFLNEFLAYLDLVPLEGTISERSYMITTFALCGFANFASIGIQIGGIGSLAESRKTEIAKLSLKAMFGGAIVSLLNASVAGMFFIGG
ncbi:MAG: nucleoside transporter C-terminal domain-containing protein [Bacteroidia bacterium]|nr:nucleoside transporter C-terminal domain-containing protein [Bacteroidia bacterium]